MQLPSKKKKIKNIKQFLKEQKEHILLWEDLI